MKRHLVALIAGAVLVGLMTPQAIADEVARSKERIELQTRYTLKEFGQDLAQLQASLALAESSVFGGDEDWRYEECRFQSLQRGLWTSREENLTAACVVERWSVPGGLSQLMAVGSCESGWNRFSDSNPPYVGLFQHHQPSWEERVHTWDPDGWGAGLDPRWTNSRSQIVVTVRMARADGDWGQWAGCA